MNSKIIFTILFFNVLAAQKSGSIQADRPDQTETPAITPTHMLQVETGITYQKDDSNSESLALPSVLWKYGLSENFELRVITEFVSNEIDSDKSSGFNPVLIGCKIRIAEEKGIFPKTSFIGHISIPKMASTSYKLKFAAPEFRFVMQHTLSEKLSLGYNIGSEWDGISLEPTFIYTFTTGYSITDKLGSYIELFGFTPQKGKASHHFDGGFSYLINDNFMLDLSSGIGITKNATDYYLAFGFSFRI
jgi:Putative MetA-pathway of phenol degradation